LAKKFNLSVVISAVDKATAPVRKISKNLQGMARGIAKINNKLRAMARATGLTKLAGTLGNATRKVGAFGKSVGVAGLKVAAIAGGIALMIRRTTQAGDQLAKISRRVGVSIDTLSKFGLAAERAGIPQETFARGLRNVARNADAARRGTGESLAFFKGLDIEFQKSNGELRDTEDILRDIADRFKDAPDGPEKTVAAMRLLGEEAGPLMINMLNDGSAGLDEMAKKAERLGVVISEEDAVAMEEFNNSIADVMTGLQGIAQAITTALLPVLKPLVDSAIDFVVANRELVKTKAITFLKQAGEAVKGFFNIIVKVVKFVEPFVDLLGGPGVVAFAAIAAIIFGPVLLAFGAMILAFIQVAVALVPVIIAAATAAGGFGALAISVAAVLLPLLAIVALGALIFFTFKKVNDAVQEAGGWGLVFEGFAITVVDAFDSVIDSIKEVIAWVGDLGAAIADKLSAFFPGGVFEFIGRVVSGDTEQTDESGPGGEPTTGDGSPALPGNLSPLTAAGGAGANGEVDVNLNLGNLPSGSRVETRSSGEGVNISTEMGINLAVQ